MPAADRTANLGEPRRRACSGAVTLSGLDRAHGSCALAADRGRHDRARTTDWWRIFSRAYGSGFSTPMYAPTSEIGVTVVMFRANEPGAKGAFNAAEVLKKYGEWFEGATAAGSVAGWIKSPGQSLVGAASDRTPCFSVCTFAVELSPHHGTGIRYAGCAAEAMNFLACRTMRALTPAAPAPSLAPQAAPLRWPSIMHGPSGAWS